jgi:hypothetical protein
MAEGQESLEGGFHVRMCVRMGVRMCARDGEAEWI